MQVHVAGHRMWLTYLELRPLLELAAHAGFVVTRDELLRRVWGDPEVPTRRLDVQISSCDRTCTGSRVARS
ncbi:MAG: hypothetical protein EXR66_04175 [Dehalococcoidia bacterium]|nr:hypothetical protein [Dehalococcoidia bacterium]